ncbi:MAG TPA: DUF1223 domain-containing protein [Thiotrichaceae bacterium]|jgi:hypothetical protein|nr:DUF1223 domain-containing protein [Thiotrichaceae bacterium]HIM08986.1 DUF1223 domain-containing protein [Gammaproteobacteria bacterium]
MLKYKVLILFSTLFFGVSLQAELLIASPNTRVSLLELYTSEGCSSCPPADRWFSELKSHPGLWNSIIPVGFHVDYWNYIGWEDRFSSPEYASRQRRYARSKNLKTVYTPGFLLNGKEWRSFYGLRKLSVDSGKEVGSLKLKVNDMELVAEYKPTENMSDKTLVLNVVVLGFDIKTNVTAGENNNKELKHDFTVLGYKIIPLYKNESAYTVMTELPDIIETAPRMAISAWINKENDMTPVQAAGGWLSN